MASALLQSAPVARGILVQLFHYITDVYIRFTQPYFATTTPLIACVLKSIIRQRRVGVSWYTAKFDRREALRNSRLGSITYRANLNLIEQIHTGATNSCTGVVLRSESVGVPFIGREARMKPLNAAGSLCNDNETTQCGQWRNAAATSAVLEAPVPTEICGLPAVFMYDRVCSVSRLTLTGR